VTDKGQALDDIAPPPSAGLAEATQIAPERKASPLPSPTSELSSPGFASPGIVVSDHPQSPATLIPATDGSSTRPTKGGIAYPFSLKVDGVDGGANASMLTLQSLGIKTPDAVDMPQVEKQLGATSTFTSLEKDAVSGAEEGQRPGVERFYTAAPGVVAGAGLFSSGVHPDVVGAKEVERPVVERFETAQEDLNMVAAGSGKA